MTAQGNRHNLPAEPNDFIGRERDVSELRDLCRAVRVVTLCGPGGIGKTRLGLRVAAGAAEDRTDGAWLVELADVAAQSGVDPVATRVAATFGVVEEPGRTPTARVIDALADLDILLVLDNCEHVVEDCAGLCQELLVACPRVRILATSREPLRITGETVWRVPPLVVPREGAPLQEVQDNEAVHLFAARAAAARPGFEITDSNAGAVIQICRGLDGMPLAVELAAARVRVLSAEQIAERLGDRFRVLSDGGRTTSPRQRTLRATIDWSFQLLGPAEQMVLRRLSVFSGWSLGEAEQVCASEPGDDGEPVEPEDILDIVTALVDKSLIQLDREVAGESRFRMLDSIRHYAAEQLAAAGERTLVRGRHRDTIVEFAEWSSEVLMAEHRGPWAAISDLFQRYDVEGDNIRAALTFSLEHGDVAEALRICVAMRAYWTVRGYYAESARWFDRCLTAAGGVGEGIRGAALVGRALVAVEQGDVGLAATAAAEGLPLCRAHGDAAMTSTALVTLADVDARAGRYTEASRHAEEAIAVARGAAEPFYEVLGLIGRCAITARQGRLREAQQLAESALEICGELDHRWGAARALIGLGGIAQARGDHVAAGGYYERALPVLYELDATPEIARCLGGIGRTLIAQGEVERARDVLAESLTLSRRTGSRLGVARALEAVAELAARIGDVDRSVQIVAAAAALRESIDGARPIDGARLEVVLDPARRKLGETMVAALWAEGRALSVDAAIARGRATTPDLAVIAVSADAGRRDGAPIPTVPAARASSTPAPNALTAREREIVGLIARGLSNRAIADELFISPATAARHVTNILTKLGFTSRAQVAAWAVERDPRT